MILSLVLIGLYVAVGLWIGYLQLLCRRVLPTWGVGARMLVGALLWPVWVALAWYQLWRWKM